jgi:hypothetical protein
VAGALEADELGDVFEILSEDEALAFGDDRHVAHAELQQAIAPAGVVQNVYGFERYAFTRKKLFRPKTAASARLGEERKFFSDDIHGISGVSGSRKATPAVYAAQGSAR